MMKAHLVTVLSVLAFAALPCAAAENINQPVLVVNPPKPYLSGRCGCETCFERTETDNDCVSFSQAFGRTPIVADSPVGRLLVLEFSPNRLVSGPDVLRYNHPLMRRIIDEDPARNEVTVDSSDGWLVTYRAGRPCGWVTGADLAIRRDPATGLYIEQLPDRTLIFYGPDNDVAYAVTPAGVRLDRSNWGIDVIRFGHAIRQVWSAADGLLEVTRLGRGRFSVAWYPPAAVSAGRVGAEYAHTGSPAKTFEFSYSRNGGEHRFSLIERRNAQFTFHYLWTNRGGTDWTFVRDPDGLALTDAKTSVIYSGTRRVLRTFSDASGRSRTEVSYESVGPDGAFVTGRGFIDTNGTETLEATFGRVASGPARGRKAWSVNRTGGQTDFIYDDRGRLLAETTPAAGGLVRAVSNEYTSVLSDGFIDTRVRRRREYLGGVLVSDVSYDYDDAPNGRTETTVRRDPSSDFTRTSFVRFHPAASGDPAAQGRIALVVRENGTATAYAYTSATSGGYVHTATHGIWNGNAFATVDGKSTRTITAIDCRGNAVLETDEALVGGVWHAIGSVTRTFNLTHRAVSEVRSDGRSSSSEWICTGPVWTLSEDGIAVTNCYDAAKRNVKSVRYGPFGAVTTELTIDPEGRVLSSTRSAPGLAPETETTSYDAAGRPASRTDAAGRVTAYSRSTNGRVETVTLPSGGTQTTTLDASGAVVSVTGSAVMPEYRTYGVTADGLEWTCVRYGRDDSPRYEKTYRNSFGETVRIERPGFGDATLVIENIYDTKGRLVSMTETGKPSVTYSYDIWGDLIATTQSADGVTRTVERSQGYAFFNSEIWRGGTRTVRTSDATIAPLVTASWSKASGLSLGCIDESFTVDVRGNTNRTWSAQDPAGAKRTTCSQQAGIDNLAEEELVDGATVRMVSHSAVTNTVAYDAFRRQIAMTDGRGNISRTLYDSHGYVSAQIDAMTNTTFYAYDQSGRLAAVTNALGNVTRYEYDLRGNKIFEGGAMYPVRYTYDVYGNKISMTTYRDFIGELGTGNGESVGVAVQGDVTRWLYDEASSCMTNKVYADGKGPTYEYDAYGRLTKRTWARGVETMYAYDGWDNLTNTVYSDETPSVVLTYDAMGRQTCAIDAAGTTTFAYDSLGSLTNETVVGVAGTNTIERFYDAFGRDAGYALNGVRQSTLGYDHATGRLATMQAAGGETPFTWNYLAGSGLKSSLLYPNGLTASWTYGNRGELLEVDNARPVSSSPSITSNGVEVVSKYIYTYDAAGRRVGCDKSGSAFMTPDTYAYLYNARSELTNATAAVDAAYNYGYDFDDIGNRRSSVERRTQSAEYIANNLNQYTSVDTFVPQYDADGNQTLVKTSTGIWSVTYNGENRPTRWGNGDMVITMSYDRMGRRVTKNDKRFVYDGYLQIADNIGNAYVWNPTESVATRPLAWQRGTAVAYYTHDGNKNVSEVIDSDGALAAHYEYAPFGIVISQRGASAAANPWRFSSEYAEDDIATVCYNYRHYEAAMGRWMSRDPIMYGKNIYGMVDNNIQLVTDSLGLEFTVTNHVAGESPPNGWGSGKVHATALTIMTKLVDISINPTTVGCAQGCYKFAVVFPMIQVDIFYKDEYHRIQSYPDEMEHVQCYRKWHDKLTEIANTAKGMSCMSPEAANSAIEGFINDADSAAEECEKCNAELDKEGGPHGH